MNQLPRIFGHRKQHQQAKEGIDPKNHLRHKPRLERRNAAKHFDYDAGSSSSSFDDPSFSTSLLQTRSLDFYDRTSFRIDGVDGELDRICWSLGLSGPEDLSIPAAVWEAMKLRSTSDILPSLKKHDLEEDEENENEVKEKVEIEIGVVERDDCDDGVSVRVPSDVIDLDENGIKGNEKTGVAARDDCDDIVSVRVSINGVRPPMLKPPPGIRVSVVEDTCSTWDILRDFAPQGEGEENYRGELEEGEAEKEEGGEEGSGKREEENAARLTEIVAEFSESCSFTTSNEDDSSSTTIDPWSNNVSPNGRFWRNITNWQKGELLGRGSFGSVYEGISEDGFFFAVKEVSLLDQGDQGKQSVYQLEQEIALLSQFEHENIVQYYGTETDESNLYIFLELVTKGSLQSLYRRYDLRDSQVSAYTRQILHGLKYLHDRKVVHRDIKCANILVDANGSVKLADFGLAKAVKLNDVKSCKGTAFWMAPEVVKGKSQGYGLPADIWSLGCTVLEMLTGKIPYSHLECMQALFRIGKGEPPPVPDSLSKDARDFIRQCLQVNPDDRPTAAELLNQPFVQRPLSQSSGSTSPYIPRRRG